MSAVRSKRLLAAAVTASLALTLGACSTKASGGESASEAGGIKTGAGISGDTITLGVLGDLTGPFAALTTDHTRGVETYWDEVNAAGGVCEQYQVELDVKDHGYNVQNAVSMYSQMTPNILAYQDFVGGSHTAAILEQAERDHRLIVPSSSTQHLAESDVVMVPALFYNLDMELVTSYLIEEGLIKDGDTVGVIYLEGDFGESGHKGALAAAETHNLDLKEYMVKASDSDMTAPVNDAVRAGASAILVASIPAHTSSVAAVLQSGDRDITMGGSWPSYTPSMLDNTGGEYLEKHFYAGSPATTYDTKEGQDLLAKLQDKFPGENLTNQASMGYGSAWMVHQVLEKACAAGDLTPEGVIAAKKSMEPLASNGIMPDMDFSVPGQSPTKSLFMFRMDAGVEGGLRNVTDGLYISEELTD
ncbi:ABC transporter substrate-binding protein [Arthrobacter sulfonylureivorans]|uniref:ABC transporter substrate-binding protein n=1 Tax=Arthrobacter sulfonylureivorans TaxID=2486855 RepID=UPI0039E676AD